MPFVLGEFMIKRYGLPYKGSKNKIAKWVVEHIPTADIFIDLFAGGCAVTHAALEEGRWQKYIANDINKTPKLFINAINGKYHNEKRWISREEFEAQKDKDAYISTCWSFGNNGRDYLYSQELEAYKKAVHELIFAETLKERRLKFLLVIRELNKYLATTQKTLPIENIKKLERLQSLERLERLQRDYREIDIPQNTVVYCDIPYRDTNKYNDFSHDEFYEWFDQQKQLTIVSEYTAPPNSIEIACITKSVAMQANGKGKNQAVEKLFVHKNFYNEYLERMNQDYQEIRR